MNNKMKLSVMIIGVLLLPQITFAAWWNPFSWPVFGKPVTTIVRVPPAVATTTMATTTKKTEVKAPALQRPTAPLCDQDCIDKLAAKKLQQEEAKRIQAKATEEERIRQTDIEDKKRLEALDPSRVAVGQFLENPTVDNFRIFCEKARNLQGWSTKQGLDSKRENIVSIKANLYDDVNCAVLSQPGNATYNLPDSRLNLALQPNDTDPVREAKIKINQQIVNQTANSKFVIFTPMFSNPNFVVPAGVDKLSFESSAQFLLTNGKVPRTTNVRIIISSVFSPVWVLRNHNPAN